MSIGKRILNIFKGLFMIAFGILIAMFPDEGCDIVIFVLVFSLFLYSFRLMIYYFSMARYMVGGIMTFYKSIIVFDFALFLDNLKDLPVKTILTYLIAGMIFSGVLDILRASEGRKMQTSSWKYQFFYGFVKIILPLVCLPFLNSMEMLAYVYSITLFHSAISYIVTAFRKTAIVYIE